MAIVMGVIAVMMAVVAMVTVTKAVIPIDLESIARGTLALFGTKGYATLTGGLAMPRLIAQAAAPSIGAFLLARTGVDVTLGVLAGVALVNVLLTTILGLLAVRRGLVPT